MTRPDVAPSASRTAPHRPGLRALTALGAVVALALPILVASAFGAATPTGPGRVLAQRLRAAGRAEAQFDRETPDPMTGRRSRLSGRLALELPDRFSLDVPATGERVTATGAGGAWLQPDLKQLIRLGPEQASAARRAWQVLLGEAGAAKVEPLGANRWVLRLAEDDPLRVTVTLGSDKLPSRVDYEENGQALTYHLRSWRFVPRKGPQAFTLTAPAGYDTLRLP